MSFNPQITFQESGGDAPVSIGLAPTQDIRVFSIVARWDGSGASGAYHPACSLYSQDGKLLARTRPEQTFAAGDSGVVTYAPFLHSEPEVVGGDIGPAFSVVTFSGADEWSDVYYVPAGAGAAVQVTNAPVSTINETAHLSPDETKILFHLTDGVVTSALEVMDIDGSNVVQLVTSTNNDPQWIDDDTVMYQDGTNAFRRINVDGSGAALIVSKTNIDTGQPSPDGTKLAYIRFGGAVDELWIVNVDGTGDTRLVANLGSVSGLGGPAWRRDGSRIVFPNGANLDSILPDGTGQQTEIAPRPAGFFFRTGMGDDRFFYTNTALGTKWRMAAVVFGSGGVILSPTLYMSRSVFRGVAVYDQGRVFTVQDGANMGGVDSLVSVLADGSDYTVSFTPDQSGAPIFQNVSLR